MKDILGESTGALHSAKTTAEIEFIIRWSSDEASHEERFLARKVNAHRDELPPGFDTALKNAQAPAVVKDSFIPGKLLPGLRPRKRATLTRDCFKPYKIGGRLVEPTSGRFFPYTLLSSHPGIRTTDIRPSFRVLNASGNDLEVDFNHPLAAMPLEVEARLLRVIDKRSRSSLAVWMEEICMDGPGMQARANSRRTAFATAHQHLRQDDGDDAQFYETPPEDNLLDHKAQGFFEAEYAKVLKPGQWVLDLMAGAESHLPQGMEVTGLGLDQQGMQANPALADFTISNLNQNPQLPFDDMTFDSVVCTLGVEYLTNPEAVVAEVCRVLKPGGVLLVGFSNRFHQSKATALWQELHEFERMGLVLDWLLEAGFEACRTLSIRNHWRPQDDPLFELTWDSDPVYIVSAIRR